MTRKLVWYKSPNGPICGVCGATIADTETAMRIHTKFHLPKWKLFFGIVYFKLVEWLDTYLVHNNRVDILPKHWDKAICEEYDALLGVPVKQLYKEKNV